MAEPIITAWEMYWITRLDAIMPVSIMGSVISVITTALFFAFRFIEGDDALPNSLRRAHWFLIPTTSLFLSCAVFLPTTKQMAAILVVPVVANNEEVQGMGADLVGLAREWMQAQKKQLAEKEETK